MIVEVTTLYYGLEVKNLKNISLKRLTRWMRMKNLCGRRLMLSYVSVQWRSQTKKFGVAAIKKTCGKKIQRGAAYIRNTDTPRKPKTNDGIKQ
jgi:hypothetical protein